MNYNIPSTAVAPTDQTVEQSTTSEQIGDTNPSPNVEERNEASVLIYGVITNLHSAPNGAYDIINELHNNGGEAKEGVLKGVREVVERAKYFNGSQVGRTDTLEGLGAWRDALVLSEALFYTNTQINALESRIDFLKSMQDGSERDDEIHERVIAYAEESLREALDAAIDLHKKGDSMRDGKVQTNL